MNRIAALAALSLLSLPAIAFADDAASLPDDASSAVDAGGSDAGSMMDAGGSDDAVSPPDDATMTGPTYCQPELCGTQNPATGPGGDDCYCDEQCQQFGDCCPDVDAVCDAGGGGECGDGTCDPGEEQSCPSDCGDPEGSCAERCGTFGQGESCQCDIQCEQFGDCCPDFGQICDPTSCAALGCGQAGNVCSCVEGQCGGQGNIPCCPDLETACAGGGDNQPGTCAGPGKCGTDAPQGSGTGTCYCGDSCEANGDCCSDYVAQCKAGSCQPSCAPANACGPDGCGGECGTCEAGVACVQTNGIGVCRGGGGGEADAGAGGGGDVATGGGFDALADAGGAGGGSAGGGDSGGGGSDGCTAQPGGDAPMHGVLFVLGLVGLAIATRRREVARVTRSTRR